MTEFNPFQKSVAQNYCGGDFSHVSTTEEAKEVGDTLFYFLIVELSTTEGCNNADDARQRLYNASQQVLECHNAIA